MCPCTGARTGAAFPGGWALAAPHTEPRAGATRAATRRARGRRSHGARWLALPAWPLPPGHLPQALSTQCVCSSLRDREGPRFTTTQPPRLTPSVPSRLGHQGSPTGYSPCPPAVTCGDSQRSRAAQQHTHRQTHTRERAHTHTSTPSTHLSLPPLSSAPRAPPRPPSTRPRPLLASGQPGGLLWPMQTGSSRAAILWHPPSRPRVPARVPAAPACSRAGAGSFSRLRPPGLCRPTCPPPLPSLRLWLRGTNRFLHDATSSPIWLHASSSRPSPFSADARHLDGCLALPRCSVNICEVAEACLPVPDATLTLVEKRHLVRRIL